MRKHTWICNGPCKNWYPYYGILKRAVFFIYNRQKEIQEKMIIGLHNIKKNVGGLIFIKKLKTKIFQLMIKFQMNKFK